MLNETIRVAGVIPECVVNAPGGISYVIFAQGCKHNCPGCHNPETHDFNGGREWKVKDLLIDIEKYPLSNIVAFTGGDAFFQPNSFYELAKKLKEKQYTLVAYSGFYFEELIKDGARKKLLYEIDILIDGPFLQKQKDRNLNYRGSRNQRILDVKKSIEENQAVIMKKYYESMK
ncbi:4Fe-4S cluster-binding domain-containing protein [Natranaerobius trueperi]|uniref:Anaerobic ribonucleoside-triphosphate reductase-activating protein n=1 Tax=Natranaerobius trueperi TaxID=759412 RepID=A0A226C0H1_9FIRM|nr:4Fe-4S cluster-binding domain-containing protein [Natranaerobius trueperi]OWZ84542.1 anaerobic ribonucleoside-triphosphate reductase activating protein [Natranaerobius trueperi]